MFEQNSTLIMIGDSVTDAGRVYPLAENRKEDLGKGYPSLVNALLAACYPQLSVRMINAGISGNTVRSLKERWQKDVLDYAPDYLSVMIGINDIWRQFDDPQLTGKHVYIDEFEATYRELIEKAKESGRLKGLYLISCCFMEPNKQEPMRKMVEQYNAVTKKLAQEYGAVYVDAQAAFDKVMEYKHPMYLTWDRVHPQLGGHMVIAREFLKAAGYDLA